MKRDLKSFLYVEQTLHPAARAATGTGTSVDTRTYDSAMAIVNFGAWTDGTHTPKLQESDDATTFTDVAAGDLQGSFSAVSGTASQNAAQRVGYIGSKRYLRGFVTVAGGTTGALSGFTIALGHAARQPV